MADQLLRRIERLKTKSHLNREQQILPNILDLDQDLLPKHPIPNRLGRRLNPRPHQIRHEDPPAQIRRHLLRLTFKFCSDVRWREGQEPEPLRGASLMINISEDQGLHYHHPHQDGCTWTRWALFGRCWEPREGGGWGFFWRF